MGGVPRRQCSAGLRGEGIDGQRNGGICRLMMGSGWADRERGRAKEQHHLFGTFWLLSGLGFGMCIGAQGMGEAGKIRISMRKV